MYGPYVYVSTDNSHRQLNSIAQAGINGTSEAMFHPYRHHLFSKNEPARMQISRNALEDEIFLLLVFLYSEVKRQDAQVSTVDLSGELAFILLLKTIEEFVSHCKRGGFMFMNGCTPAPSFVCHSQVRKLHGILVFPVVLYRCPYIFIDDDCKCYMFGLSV